MDLKTINKKIALVRTNAGKFNALVQETAVAIIEHAKEHGDANPAVRLVLAMGKSTRRGLLVTFFKEYSPIRLAINTKDEGKSRCSLAKVGDKGYTDFNIDGAKANMWYDVAGSEKEQGLNTLMEVDGFILSLAKRLEKQLENNQIAETSIPAVKRRIEAIRAIFVAPAKEETPANDEPKTPVKAAAPAPKAA